MVGLRPELKKLGQMGKGGRNGAGEVVGQIHFFKEPMPLKALSGMGPENWLLERNNDFMEPSLLKLGKGP